MDNHLQSLEVSVRNLFELSQSIRVYSKIVNFDDIDTPREPMPIFDDDDQSLYLAGREKEVELILNIFKDSLNSSTFDNVVKIIILPLFGFGVMGKTWLARAIYYNMEFRENFDLVAWVPILDISFATEIMMSIVSKLGVLDKIGNSHSLDVKYSNFQKIISNNRFFIVFDGVAKLDKSEWDVIKSVLEKGRGAVIVTTQLEEIALKMGNTTPIKVGAIDEDACEYILGYYAYDREVLPSLAAYSSKLNGWPLAAKIIGKQLLKSHELGVVWRGISRCEWWQTDVEKLFPSIGFIYCFLDSHVKQCFAYCAIFPKNFVFGKDKVVQMWIAQDYIKSNHSQRDEDIGSEYFEDLLEKLFFLREEKGYIMHECMFILAKIVFGDECYSMDHESSRPPKTMRHLTITEEISGDVVNKVADCKMVRTLLVISKGSASYKYDGTLDALIKELKGLRVIFLSCTSCSSPCSRQFILPSSVGNLPHLRYLNLQGNGNISLDSSLCNLYHLEVLNIIKCYTNSLPYELTV